MNSVCFLVQYCKAPLTSSFTGTNNFVGKGVKILPQTKLLACGKCTLQISSCQVEMSASFCSVSHSLSSHYPTVVTLLVNEESGCLKVL